MIDFTVRRNLPLPLGRVGDNGAVRMCFPKHFVDTDLPSGGSYALVYRNPQGGTYPRVITEDAENVYWTVLNEDTQYEGPGEVELRYLFGDDGAYNSEIWHTYISPSLVENGEAPAEYQSWVDEVTRQAAAAELAVEHYPYIDEESGNWMVWDADNGEWVDTEIHAQGPQGPQGVVKVFELSSLTDYETASEAVREVEQSGTAIIRYGERYGEFTRKLNYIYQDVLQVHPAGKYMFIADYVVPAADGPSYSAHFRSYLLVEVSEGSVEWISLINDDGRFLDPTKTYSEPFIPTDDGHPATKKYVDEKIGDGLYIVPVLSDEDYDHANYILQKVSDGNYVIATHDHVSGGNTFTAYFRLTDYISGINEQTLLFITGSSVSDVYAIEIKSHPDEMEPVITFYYNS